MLKKIRFEVNAYTEHLIGNFNIAWYHIKHGAAHLIHGVLPFIFIGKDHVDY